MRHAAILLCSAVSLSLPAPFAGRWVDVRDPEVLASLEEETATVRQTLEDIGLVQ